MLILRIKQAECALADGRLEEACTLLSDAALRSHRRGQELVGETARALVERGRQHLSAGRLAEAQADADRAGRLAGSIPEVAALRNELAGMLLQRRNVDQQRAQILDAARHQMQQGQFTACQGLLVGVDAPAAMALQDEVARNRAVLDGVLAKAADALGRKDWEGALELLARSPVVEARVRELCNQVVRVCSPKLREAMGAGRLDLAEAMLVSLGRLPCQGLELEEMRRTMDQCRTVWRQIAEGDLHAAEQGAQRLAGILEADWLESLIADLRAANQAMHRVRCGPLSLLEPAGEATHAWHTMAQAVPAAAPSPAEAPAGAQVPARFLLQVDGAGSYMVLRGGRITVGPASSSIPCDLALLAGAQTPTVTIERNDEDYILRSELPVLVNDRPVKQKALAGGDRIALSPRCRMTFRLPSPASTTAVLDLSGARAGRADLKQVVLMDREVILGPGPAAHVRCDAAQENVLLMVRDGRLACRSRGEVRIDGRPASASAAISPGAHVSAGELSFVVTSA